MPNYTTTITLDDGTVINNVPPGVTKEDLEERKRNALLPYVRDVIKVPTKAVQRTMEAVADVPEMAGIISPEQRESFGEQLSLAAESVYQNVPIISQIRKVLGEDEPEPYIDPETGDVAEFETLAGTVGEIGTYIAGGTGLYRLGPQALSKTGKALKGFAAGAGINQILSDPVEGNLANILVDMLPDSAGKNEFIRTVTSDVSDPKILQRAKLFAGDVGLGVLFGTAAATAVKTGSALKYVAQRSDELFGKSVSELNEIEEADLLIDVVKSNSVNVSKTKPQKIVEDPEEVAQVLKQASDRSLSVFNPRNLAAFARRVKQQVFTSRGYLTPEGFEAREGTKHAIRAAETRAGYLASSIKKKVENLSDKINTKKLNDNINLALTSQDDFLKEVPVGDRAFVVSMQFDIPENIALDVLAVRGEIDQLSASFLQSNKGSETLRAVIRDNIGEYFNRSYRRFEETGFVPSADVRAKAERYIANQYEEAGMKPDKALAKAADDVSDILGENRLQADDYTYTDALNRINDGILNQKKEIPPVIRKLLGEVTDPSERIVNTVSNLSRLVENQRFFETMNTMGQRGKYIFKATDSSRNRDVYSIKIQGTNSSLDGKYTTPEIASALAGREGRLFYSLDGAGGAAVKSLIGLKGYTQKFATVYNPLTQARNILGAPFFAIANGYSPFAVKQLEYARTIAKQDMKRVSDSYARYQELGVVNTSTRLSEYKELLRSLASDETGTGKEAFTSISKYFDKKFPKTAKGLEKIEGFYAGVDDFAKITIFNKELDVLKKAFPNKSLSELEQLAANKVKNNVPNYDRVPKAIKMLREVPVMGAFVSFPSEIIRTSANIIRTASSEINSGNAVLRQQGLKRLAGYTTAMSAGALISEQTAQLVGLSSDDKRAVDTLMRSEYSRGPFVYSLDSEGQLKASSIEYSDTYDTMKRPIIQSYEAIREGRLRGEELDAMLVDAAATALKELGRPYLTSTMLNTATINFYTAVTSEDGKGSLGGRQLLSIDPNADISEKISRASVNFMFDLSPGVVKEAEYLSRVVTEAPSGMFGDIKTIEDWSSRLYTGLNGQDVNPLNDLKKATVLYKAKVNSLAQPFPRRLETFEDMQKRSKNYMDKRRELSQEFYERYMAADFLITDPETRKEAELFLKNNLTARERIFLLSGREVMAPDMNITRARRVLDYYKDQAGELSHEELKKEIDELNQENINRRLQREELLPGFVPYSDEEEEPESFTQDMLETLSKRLGMEKGGEVTDVPNVPTEPDQRIDKMTGMPYDQQAGMAFVDEEDPVRRLGFVGGGLTQDPLQRLGFVGGGLSKVIKLGIKAIDEGDDKAFKEAAKEDVSPTSFLKETDEEDARAAADMTVDDIAKWQEENSLPQSQRQKQRPEIVEQLVEVLGGRKAIEEYRDMVDKVFPPTLYTKETAPKFPSLVEVRGGVGKKTMTGGRGIIGADVPIEEGKRVSSRLDIPAYDQRNVWAVTLHAPGKSGKAFAYGQTAILKNVDFTTNPKTALDIALGMNKGTIARMEGDWVNHNPRQTYEKAVELLDSDEWVQVGMNPFKHSYFYDKKTMQPVVKAEEVIQVGPLVLVKKKGIQYASPDDEMFKVDLTALTDTAKLPLNAMAKEGKVKIGSTKFVEGGRVLSSLKRRANGL